MHRMLRVYAAAFPLLLLVIPPVRGQPTSEEIRLRNAASQAAIRTLEARLDVVMQFNLETTRSGLPEHRYVIVYVRSGSKERLKEIESPLGLRDSIRDVRSEKGSMFTPKGSG